LGIFKQSSKTFETNCVHNKLPYSCTRSRYSNSI